MTKANQKAPSAAQRRERERQQRQQRLASNKNSQSQARNKGPKRRQSNQRQWLLIGGVLAIIAVIIIAFVIISRQPSGSQSGQIQVSSQVFNAVTNVDPNVSGAIGTGGVQNPLHTVNGPPPVLVGPTGKPQFLYIGADYCPFCAGQRWAIVVALSHFGTFSKLYQTTSSSVDVYPNTSTFTFSPFLYGGSLYTSSYIDFVAVETQGNQQDASGNYPVLQTPTTEQQQLLTTYDAPPYTTQDQAGSIPFVDIANQYLAIGLSQGFSPKDLQGLQWQDIANNLADSTSTVAKGIIGTSNYMTAGICMVTHQQPANVCSTDTIQKIEQSLGKSAVAPGGTQIAVAGHLEAVIRREVL
jgi:Domain of unknown function (DUF929)